MKYFFSCIFLITCSLLPAQVSGYLGKRFLVELQPQVATSGWGWSHWIWDMKTRFLVSPGVHVEYVLGRKGALTLDYHFSNQKQTFWLPTEMNTFFGDTTYHSSEVALPIRSHNAGLNYRFYFVRSDSWGLAPIGPYVALGARISTAGKTNLPDSAIANYVLPQAKLKTYFCFSLGSRNVFWHRITLDYAVGLNISTLRPSFSNMNKYQFYDNWDIGKINEYNQFILNEGVRRANFFTARIGIGALLF